MGAAGFLHRGVEVCAFMPLDTEASATSCHLRQGADVGSQGWLPSALMVNLPTGPATVRALLPVLGTDTNQSLFRPCGICMFPFAFL